MSGCQENRLSFGAELEWSDVDRRQDIPEELGSWEGPKIAGRNLGSELDIVNTRGKWKGIATDPFCIQCPVGGEIHVAPSYTIESQFTRIMRIMKLFSMVGVACTNHGHIHVGVKDIWRDLESVKNIFRYTEKNEYSVLKFCNGYDKADRDKIRKSSVPKWAQDYLLIGDAKKINPELYPLVENANCIDEIKYQLHKIPAIDYDWIIDSGQVTENSHRTAVNLYSLLEVGTVEFRVFRASINPVEIYSSLVFCKRYMEEALKGWDGKSVEDILKEGNFKFAKLNFNEELTKSWVATRGSKESSGCLKKSTGVLEPTEDRAITDKELEIGSVEDGIYTLLVLCQEDMHGKY
jgi:hypothetical protein